MAHSHKLHTASDFHGRITTARGDPDSPEAFASPRGAQVPAGRMAAAVATAPG